MSPRDQARKEQLKYRNTRLLVKTTEALKERGKKGETYDQIIEDLLAKIEMFEGSTPAPREDD
jgi:uncharacterized membrane-anchored protein